MVKEDKKRIAKIVVLCIGCIAAMGLSKSAIDKKITKQPTKDIVNQLSSTFWSIVIILIRHYYIDKKSY